MQIFIRNTSDQPIYDQICTQLREQILAGALPAGTPLPSIRALARDLRVSVITTKRAYEELERAGLVTTVPGKGSFVAEQNLALVREAHLREMEEHLRAALALSRSCNVTTNELAELLRTLAEEDET